MLALQRRLEFLKSAGAMDQARAFSPGQGGSGAVADDA
jgi:hypothetical protein